MADLHPLVRPNRSAGRGICMPKSIVFLAVFIVFGILMIAQTAQAKTLIFDRSEIGFSTACSYYKISEPQSFGEFTLSLHTLRIDGYTENAGTFNKNPSWKDWEWKLKTSYTVDVPEYGTCYNDVIINNGTCADIGCGTIEPDKCNCSYACQIGSHQEERERFIWIQNNPANLNDYKDELYSQAIETGYTEVRFCSDFTREKTSKGWEISIDHVPEFAGMSYPEYIWWNSSYSNRTCWKVTNPYASAETNITFKFYLNMSTFTMASENCTDVEWGNQTSGLGYWNSTGCNNTGQVNTTWWVNAPTVATNNETKLCMYYNSSDDDTPGADITTAGIFGDDFDDIDISDWSADACAGDSVIYGGLPTATSGYVRGASDNQEGMHMNLSSISMPEYRIVYRGQYQASYTTVDVAVTTGYCYTHSQYGDGDSVGTGTNTAGSAFSFGDTAWTANTWYDIEFARDQAGYWYTWKNNDAVNFNTKNLTNSSFNSFISFGVSLRRTNDRIDHVLWTKWCQNCTLTRQAEETTEEEAVTTAGLDFIAPTLADGSYTLYNYIGVNASSSENATDGLLEWDDGTISNETMAITNASGNTTAWLNMTSLSDGEYLFTVYAILHTIGLNKTTQRNVTVDTVNPSVSITYPTATELSTQADLNFSASDTNLEECFYSLDGGVNTTVSNCADVILNDLASGGHTVIVYVNDSAGNLGSDSQAFTVMLFTLNVYNATDNGSIDQWSIYIFNTSDSYVNFTNSNPLTANITDIPGGNVEMIIWEPAYSNATFNFTNSFDSVISFERHIIPPETFVSIQTPANNSVQFADQEFTLNITIPLYAEGNASIWYSLNGTIPYTLGCINCTEFSTSIGFGFGENNISVIMNTSDHYLGNNDESKTIGVTVYHSKFNISFFDEMTNESLDFTNKNGTLSIFCSERTIEEIVTGTLNEYVINCSGSLDQIKFLLYDPKGDHFRTLIPTARSGNLTFYMINTTSVDVVKNLVTFSVTDASFQYQAGILHFKKIILTEGQKDIIDTIIGSDGKVYAYLIAGEIYTISVESEDGTTSKTLGEYTTPDSTTTSQPLTIIDVRFIPTTYNYIGTDITWGFDMDTDAERIYFLWNDTTGQTNEIKFWIYNITNVSARTQMYYDSVSGQSNHLFQWDYVTNGNENDTYLGYFEVDHAIHGNITESRPLAKGGIFLSWLGAIGAGWYHIVSVFLIIFVASIFGAKSAPIGAVILAIIAALLFYLEWLPSIIGGAVRLTDLLMISLIALSILAMFIIKRRRI